MNYVYSAVKIGDILTFGDCINYSCWLVVGFTKPFNSLYYAELVKFGSNILDTNGKIYIEPLDNLCAQISRSQNFSKEMWSWRRL